MLNWVDAVVALIVAFYVWRGWREGFIRVALDVVGLALIFWAGWRFYQPAAEWLSAYLTVPPAYGTALGFLLAGVVAASLFWIVTGLALGHVAAATHHHPLNRLLGLLPGFVGGVLVAALLVTFLSLLPGSGHLAAAVSESSTGARLTGWTTQVARALQPIFGDAIAETLDFLTVRPDSDAFLRLPYQVARPTAAPSLEAEMLRLVNQERAAAGLAPLVMDERLRQVARAHSTDMFQRGYFSHYTPERDSPFDRLQAADISYLAAGENLALAPSVEAAHRGLMNSPGHRANILSPSFRRIGIGALDGGLRGVMFSQEFTN